MIKIYYYSYLKANSETFCCFIFLFMYLFKFFSDFPIPINKIPLKWHSTKKIRKSNPYSNCDGDPHPNPNPKISNPNPKISNPNPKIAKIIIFFKFINIKKSLFLHNHSLILCKRLVTLQDLH